MARKRMIDPSFWEDEKLSECPVECRLLFMGLISQADDDGRLNGHQSLIRSNIFPYDDQITAEMVDGWINTLWEKKLIVRYVVNNQKFIFVRNFKKHQTINKPVKSKLPEPPDEGCSTTTVVLPHDDGTTPSQEKLKELNISEGNSTAQQLPHSYFNDETKDRIHNFAVRCKLRSYNIVAADDLFFYIDKVDIEVIELAIKKAYDKHINYAGNTLRDWLSEGKTTKESVQHLQIVPPSAPKEPFKEKEVDVYFRPVS